MTLKTSALQSETNRKRETGIEPATPSLGSSARSGRPALKGKGPGVSAYPLLNVKEAAKLLRLALKTVYRMTGDGRLRSVRAGGAIRIRHEDIDAFLASGARS